MVRKKSDIKKEKLLGAASDVFAEKGFRDATVSEICSRAGANISAVNYHFGSKEALYQETWRHSFSESLKGVSVGWWCRCDGISRRAATGQLTSMIQRIADENNKDFFIAQMGTDYSNRSAPGSHARRSLFR